MSAHRSILKKKTRTALIVIVADAVIVSDSVNNFGTVGRSPSNNNSIIYASPVKIERAWINMHSIPIKTLFTNYAIRERANPFARGQVSS